MDDIIVKNGIIIPAHELTITASRAGGPGGQHVNKTSTKITVRWQVKETRALTEEQKQHVLEKLQNHISADGDLIVHSSASRSQQHNKKSALEQLGRLVAQALHVPKKRKKSELSEEQKKKRLEEKKRRSFTKKMRQTKVYED
ncbi:MAG: alternative ribosome rescue aminoacyl-tRNA hydrolase ArfB [Candidatus Babeliales bacterium]